jgi:hypothetical protein
MILEALRCFRHEDTLACKNELKGKHFESSLEFANLESWHQFLHKKHPLWAHLSVRSDRENWGKATATKSLPQSCFGLRGQTFARSDAFWVPPPSCVNLRPLLACLYLTESASCILSRLDLQGGITSESSYHLLESIDTLPLISWLNRIGWGLGLLVLIPRATSTATTLLILLCLAQLNHRSHNYHHEHHQHLSL